MAAPEFFARAVATEEEVEQWGVLVGRGFSHRPGDPARFLRKYRVDPTASKPWTRVVEHTPSGRLIGSVRAFDRNLATGRTDVPWVPSIGLGEVCSDPDFRGRGVASVMMADAVAFMDAQPGHPVAALHAAEAVRPLYAKYGFAGIDYEYGWLRLPAGGAGLELPNGMVVAPVDLSTEWRSLSSLYEPFHSTALNAIGWVDRNSPSHAEAYWTRWVPNAIGSTGRLHKLVSAAGDLLAYAAVVMKPDGLKLWDFAALVGEGAPTATELVTFIGCVGRAVLDDPACVPSPPPAGDEGVKLIVPSLVLRWLAGNEKEGAAAVEKEETALAGLPAVLVDDSLVDKGWMFRPQTRSKEATSEGSSDSGETSDPAALTAAFLRAGQDRRFLLWHLDSF